MISAGEAFEHREAPAPSAAGGNSGDAGSSSSASGGIVIPVGPEIGVVIQ